MLKTQYWEIFRRGLWKWAQKTSSKICVHHISRVRMQTLKSIDSRKAREWHASMDQALYYCIFAHFMSSNLGLWPEQTSIKASNFVQNPSFSNGKLSHPVVIQKYVSWGATWCIRWCLRGRIMWRSCRAVIHLGKPKYVWDHLWNCENKKKSKSVQNCFQILREEETERYVHEHN